MYGGPSLSIKKIKIKMKNRNKKIEKMKKNIIQKKNPQNDHGP